MNIFRILLFFLIFSFSAQSEQLNFRGSSAAIVDKDDIKIRISQEMIDTDKFKKIPKSYSKAKSFAGLIDKKAQPRKKRKFRGGGDIYTDFSSTVVYIGNYEGESVGAGFLIDKAGLILTNWHVIDKADQVAVWTLPDDGAPPEYVLFEELDPMIGTVVATNKLEDLANIRLLKMVDEGFINELENLKKEYKLTSESQSMNSINYKQFLPHINGIISLDAAFNDAFDATKQLIKTQLNWMKKFELNYYANTEDINDSKVFSDTITTYLRSFDK